MVNRLVVTLNKQKTKLLATDWEMCRLRHCLNQAAIYNNIRNPRKSRNWVMWKPSAVVETLADTLPEKEGHTLADIMAMPNAKQCETRYQRER